MAKVIGARNEIYFLEDGSELIDGISGTYSLPLGHCSEAEVGAIRSSLGMVHNSYKEDDGTADKLSDMLNGLLAQRRTWHFMTTGSEAVELDFGRVGAGSM